MKPYLHERKKHIYIFLSPPPLPNPVLKSLIGNWISVCTAEWKFRVFARTRVFVYFATESFPFRFQIKAFYMGDWGLTFVF